MQRVKELGMDSIAITDHGAMYRRRWNFTRRRLEAGIKPIIGCEVYVAEGSRFTKERQGQAATTIWCFWLKIMRATII